nr:IS200/IS605 family accessory protein TnpB-related protein [Candidatus Cyanaurora vandensis]
MRDAINKAARLVINHSLKYKIGTIVFGWNKGQKDSCKLGTVNDQKFVQIPTGRLKERIKQWCEQYGLDFVETEESYTSRASFIDNDALHTFGAKPEGWTVSGKRGKKKDSLGRGQYLTKEGLRLNSDANGAGNILRKVSTTLGLRLEGVARGALTTPSRVRLWTL